MNRRPIKGLWEYDLDTLSIPTTTLSQYTIHIIYGSDVRATLILLEDEDTSLEVTNTYVYWPDDWPLELAFRVVFGLFPNRRIFYKGIFTNIAFYINNGLEYPIRIPVEDLIQPPINDPEQELDTVTPNPEGEGDHDFLC